jgi:fluoride exporter
MKGSRSARGAISPEPSLYLAVGLGSALGGSARWLISAGMLTWLGAGFPWGTLFVNVSGSLLIGLYAALVAPEGRLFHGPRQRHFIMTGFCGGYTTFSIFSLEAVRFVEAGLPALAALLVTISLVGWLLAVWAGYALGSRMNRLRRS